MSLGLGGAPLTPVASPPRTRAPVRRSAADDVDIHDATHSIDSEEDDGDDDDDALLVPSVDNEVEVVDSDAEMLDAASAAAGGSNAGPTTSNSRSTLRAGGSTRSAASASGSGLAHRETAGGSAHSGPLQRGSGGVPGSPSKRSGTTRRGGGDRDNGHTSSSYHQGHRGQRVAGGNGAGGAHGNGTPGALSGAETKLADLDYAGRLDFDPWLEIARATAAASTTANKA